MTVLFDLWRQSLAGLRLLIAATLVLGVAYPLVVFGFGQVAAPWQARGSLVTADGSRTEDPDAAVGSELIGSGASASGLDPDIPVAYAELQVARVAAATGLGEDLVRSLVADHTSDRTLAVPGELHVNVLMLNLAVLRAAGQ